MTDSTTPLSYFKKQARQLQKAVQRKDQSAVTRAAKVLKDTEEISLMRAQHIVAVEFGFPKWQDLAKTAPSELQKLIANTRLTIGTADSSSKSKELGDSRKPTETTMNTAADAIEEAVARHTVAIVTRGEDGSLLRGNGTGVALAWNDRAIIVTAAHVVKNTPTSELRFFARSAKPLQRADAAELQALRGAPTRELRGFDPIEIRHVILSQNADLDLAILEISRVDVADDRLQFFQPDKDTKVPPVGETAVTTGHPSQIARQIERNNDWVLFPSTQWTRIVEPGNQRGFNPDLHFLVEYDGVINDNVRPQGFSGAGVWTHANSPLVWHPNLLLGGIVTHYYRADNLLKQTRIEKVIEFLAESLGD